ncbi:MAG: matrixin family metalloprotease [Acidimicrobiales bacterium]
MRPTTARLTRIVSRSNSVVFAVAVAVVLTWTLIPPIPKIINLSADSWPPGHRILTVSDRTADPAWHSALAAAVSTWAQTGAGLRLVLVTQGGRCGHDLDTIEVCEEPQRLIADPEIAGRQGYVVPVVAAGGRLQSVDIVVCTDCPMDQDRRVIIATHELGHALGLPHNGSPFSVMFPSGGPFGPDPQDIQILLSKYPPAQGPV